MPRTLTSDAVTDAVLRAQNAADRAGVTTSLLEGTEEFRRADEVFGLLWGTGPANAQMPAELIRALTHSGSYAAGAFVGDRLIGAVVGFLGRNDSQEVFLHSHILGVHPDFQARSVGYSLKQHQRAWALEHGLTEVTWTFDPLVRRNAYFNVQKLAVDISSYYANFYGSMTDTVNTGDESDRVLAVWDLTAPRTVAAATERLADPDVDSIVGRGAQVVLSIDDGAPTVGAARGDTILCAVPEDIVGLRKRDGRRALDWRHALRDTLGGALNDGYVVSGFARSGWYVLTRDGAK